MTAILVEAAGGVGTVTLNRPERHNALDEHVIAELTAALARLGDDPALRAVVLRAAGKSFSAGADIGWMQRMAQYGEAENLADARKLSLLMQTLNDLPKPVVALVQGAAYGGGVGLVACCDIAIAAEGASFSLSEVKLGLIPAVISPYVLQAIGPRAARRYVLTAERFSAAEALRLGLVHEVVPEAELEAAGRRAVAQLLANGPRAVAAAKALIAEVAGRPPADVAEANARRIAAMRASPEGREGLAAFLEKRKPGWSA